MSTKTVKEWLQGLPEGYRERALKNMDGYCEDDCKDSVAHSIAHAFSWIGSPEGSAFWRAVCGHYAAYQPQGPLPPLPDDAPTIVTPPKFILPTNAEERKTYPIYSGFMAYFPHAIAEVAHLSYLGNQQHHPDEDVNWNMDKSQDELDCLMRHAIDGIDGDIGEAARVAWRAMANLERKLTGKCQYTSTKTV